MAEYAVRCTELGEQLDDLRDKQMEEERRGGPAVLLASYVRVQGGLATYYASRDTALSEALSTMKAGSSDTADSQQQQWTDFLNQKGSEALNTLTSLTSSDPDPLKQTFEQIASLESRFFRTISQIALARFHAQVRKSITELNDQLGTLSNRWKELSGSNERQDGQIATLRSQVLDMFRREVEELRGWPVKVEAAALKVVDGAGKLDELDPGPSLMPVVTASIDMVNVLRQNLEQVTRNALTLYTDKGTIHVMFANVRNDAKILLDRVNKAAIARQYSEACRAAQDRADDCTTDGQKQDARRLVDQAVRAIDEIVGKFNDKFDEFYNAFDGKFVGNVSDATVEALVDQAHFNQFWSDVRDLGLPGVFQSTADGLTSCEQLSLDLVTDDQRRRMQELIKLQLAPLKKSIRAMDSNFFERFKITFIDVPLGQMIDKLKNLPGYFK